MTVWRRGWVRCCVSISQMLCYSWSHADIWHN